jgi:hypothetical protein
MNRNTINKTGEVLDESIYFDRACSAMQNFLQRMGWEYTDNFLVKDPITGMEYPVVEAFIIASRELVIKRENKKHES